MFYGASALGWTLVALIAWRVLSGPLAIELPERIVEAKQAPRSGSGQVLKALFILGLETVLLVLPPVRALAWILRLRANGRDPAAWWFPLWWRTPFPGPRFLILGSRWSTWVAIVSIVVLASYSTSRTSSIRRATTSSDSFT